MAFLVYSCAMVDGAALVIGESLVDVVRGEDAHTEYPGGSAANVAVALARLGRPTWLATSFAEDEYGRGVVCDRSISTGVGHAVVLFSDAMHETGARDASDAAEILAWVREAESIEEWRFEGLERALRRPERDRSPGGPREAG